MAEREGSLEELTHGCKWKTSNFDRDGGRGQNAKGGGALGMTRRSWRFQVEHWEATLSKHSLSYPKLKVSYLEQNDVAIAEVAQKQLVSEMVEDIDSWDLQQNVAVYPLS